jgi:hypothetical protein
MCLNSTERPSEVTRYFLHFYVLPGFELPSYGAYFRKVQSVSQRKPCQCPEQGVENSDYIEDFFPCRLSG